MRVFETLDELPPCVGQEVATSEWIEVTQELAAEIDYGNFKDRAHSRSGDDKYVDALHDVWAVMERLQRPNR